MMVIMINQKIIIWLLTDFWLLTLKKCIEGCRTLVAGSYSFSPCRIFQAPLYTKTYMWTYLVSSDQTLLTGLEFRFSVLAAICDDFDGTL